MLKQIFAGTVQRMFIWIVVLCMVGILIFGTYSCTVVSDTIFDEIKKTSLFQMQTANEQMDALVVKIESMSLEVEKSLLFRSLPLGTEEGNDLLGSISDSDIVGACFLATPDGKEYSYNPDSVHVDMLHLKMVYGGANDIAQKFKWYDGSDENTIHQFKNHYIVRANLGEGGDTGTLYLFIRRKVIENILNVMHDKNNLVFIMNQGKLLAVNDLERYREINGSAKEILLMLYESEMGLFDFQKYNENYITAHYQAPGNDFKFLAIYENIEFYREGYSIIIIMITFITVFTALILFFYYIIRKQFITPLGEIVKHMDGSLMGEKIEIYGSHEIETLVKRYNLMCSRINEGIEDLKLQEEKKRHAEITALRYQIRPHFLYNTLSNIKVLAMTRGQSDISRSISRLAKMYKYLLSGKSDYVELSDEMEFINNYMALMNTRYDNRLTTFFLVDEELKNCRVPAFLLQPIVENSITHGLCKRLNKKIECFMRIKIEHRGDMLCLEVYDNGEGIGPEKLQKILSLKESETQELGVGLCNTIARLKHLYGDSYDFDVESVINEYTQVTIRIPFEISD